MSDPSGQAPPAPADDPLSWRPSPPEKDEEPQKKPPRVWLRVGVGVALLLALLALAGVISSMTAGRKARRDRAALEARLDADDPGWRLQELERAREEIPDAENGALIVVAAHAAVGRGWPSQDLFDVF